MRFSFGLKAGLAMALLTMTVMTTGLSYYYSVSQKSMLEQTEKRLRDIGRTGQMLFGPEERQELKYIRQTLNQYRDLRVDSLNFEGQYTSSLSTEITDSLRERTGYRTIVNILRRIRLATATEINIPDYLPDNFDQHYGLEPAILDIYIVSAIPEYPDYSFVQFLAVPEDANVDRNRTGIFSAEKGMYSGMIYNISSRIGLRQTLKTGEVHSSSGYSENGRGHVFSTYIPLVDPEDGSVIAVMGMDMDADSELHLISQMRNILFLVLSFGLVITVFAAIIVSKWLARPIEALRHGAERVRQRNFETIVPNYSSDELGMLVTTFNQMVSEIRDYAGNLEHMVEERTARLQESLEAVKKIKNQQDADYYLTTLVADPLFRNDNISQRIRTDIYLQQKKKFRFRKYTGSLGGDLCICGNLVLNNEAYVMFFNGDAMGKSMQGAGGALVMGALINSILVRSNPLQNKTQRREGIAVPFSESPEGWLRAMVQELQSVFEAFDGSMYVSCVIGLVHEKSGKLYYFNADHPFSVLYRKNSVSFLESKVQFQKIGMPIQNKFSYETYQLEDGDHLICGSDGRNDISLWFESEPGKDKHIINEDDELFLRIVESGEGDLKRIHALLKQHGILIDDLSLVSVKFDFSKPPMRRRDILGNYSPLMEAGRLISKGQYREALSIMDGIPEESLAILYYRSLCLTRIGNYNRALDYLRKAESQYPKNSKVMRLLAEVYLKKDLEADVDQNNERASNVDLAEKYIEQAMLIDPNSEKNKDLARQIEDLKNGSSRKK